MLERRFFFALEFRDDSLGQLLAQLDSPLVERVDVPDRSLGEDAMLIERNQFTQSFGSELLGQDRVRWPVALKEAMRDKPVRCAFRFNLFLGLAECQRLSLGKHVSQENVVMSTKRI